MRCSKCGTEGGVGKRFCAECGSSLPNRCSRCGSENVPKAKFCADCGAALIEPAASSTSPEHASIRVAGGGAGLGLLTGAPMPSRKPDLRIGDNLGEQLLPYSLSDRCGKPYTPRLLKVGFRPVLQTTL